MVRTRRLALSVIALAFAACGSGGSSDRLTRDELIARGDRICQGARDRLAGPELSGDIEKNAAAQAEIYDETVSDLKDLTPPDSVQSAYAAYVARGARQGDLARELSDAAGAKDGERVRTVIRDARQNAARARTLAHQVGFQVCGSG